MQNLPLLIGGLGCLLLLAVLWKPPAIQDESLQAPEFDGDEEDPTNFE